MTSAVPPAAPSAEPPLPGLADIERAATAIAGTLPITPLVESPRLGAALGCRLFLKLESLHHTGSFKERGALNKLKSLTADQAAAGVIAMSAGNHAQGVAHHARRLGIPATIVMPAGTPFNKIERTRAYGARVVLFGDGLAEAAGHAAELAARDGLTFVHPYDDPLVVAGQGTCGLEMLRQAADLAATLDVLVVPVGGGGLISGIAIAAKALRPEIQVIGVETDRFPSLRQTLDGQPVTCQGPTLAEGIAVAVPGAITVAAARRLIDDVVLVDESAVERAIYQLMMVQKLVAEGAGAAGLAALLTLPERFRGRTVGVVICGGNIDDRLLATILMRGLVRDGRLVRLRIKITDIPGALGRVAHLVGDAGGNIVEVLHHRLFNAVPVKLADLDIMVETRDRDHVGEIIDRLRSEGFEAQLMDEVS